MLVRSLRGGLGVVLAWIVAGCSSAPPTSSGPDADAGPTPSAADAQAATDVAARDASSATDAAPARPDAGGSDAGARPTSPVFACFGSGKPAMSAIVRAGIQWFESGYPGALTTSENQTLAANGIVSLAYVNMAEVPNDDPALQAQIGPFYQSIALCQNTSWSSTVVDVRDARWGDWLERRAEQAYGLGYRGIKWDVAGVEHLCNDWSGDAARAQQAIDATAAVLAKIKGTHPDFVFIVNGGFGIAHDHPSVVDGFETESVWTYADAHPGDPWIAQQIADIDAVHARGVPVFDQEYVDVFGCADTSCAKATAFIDEIAQHGWVPYVTDVNMDIEGRGLRFAPPW